MHHELVPAIASPTPGAALARLTGKILLAAILDLGILSFFAGWFWLGLQLST